MTLRLPVRLFLCCSLVCCGLPGAAQTSPTELKMQLPPDQAAYKAANRIVEPGQRATALKQFLHDFPKSASASKARSMILDLLVNQQPQDVKAVHAAAEAIVRAADKGSRADEENGVAYTLAEAPPNGIDLESAEKWGRDSAARFTQEAPYAERLRKIYTEAKVPVPSAETLHTYWAGEKANALQTLADVYFREGKLAESYVTLDQAQALDPRNGPAYAVRGSAEHAEHKDSAALDHLETAEAYGGNTAETRKLMLQLYAASHGGSESGLEAEIDARYRTLSPRFRAAPRSIPQARRAVFVELYTGSACAPCIDADAAFDALLDTYPRRDVIALAFDQHNPGPDPLANPASLARGSYGIVQGTPTVRVDGEVLSNVYGRRERQAEAFQLLADQVDRELGRASGVSVRLTAGLNAAHLVEASATVKVDDAAALAAALDPALAKDAAAGAAPSSAAPGTLPGPKLVLNFALVQREVTYSGENGVREHPMVVRGLAKPLAEEFSIAMTGESSAAHTFHPAEIQDALAEYLNSYEQHSDKFGAVRFLTKNVTMPLETLAVAAWVEDIARHRVVAAAYVPVEAAVNQASR